MKREKQEGARRNFMHPIYNGGVRACASMVSLHFPAKLQLITIMHWLLPNHKEFIATYFTFTFHFNMIKSESYFSY